MFFGKKNQEPAEMKETVVWTCSRESCTCWMREDYSFEDQPTCPICSAEMRKGTKMLPTL